ncbi:MAG TPA: sigma-70 family RNA polymerase sigma factor [Bacteroidales bacterium]|nr:sigma-70 family RNA polymerase sigma factor [Bacteroidales bacterium]
MLYRKYASTMMALCMRYARDRSEAEDLLQEGFLKVFQNISSYRKEGSFEGWIKRIMINNALNQFRKNKRLPFHKDIEEINEIEILSAEEAKEVDFQISSDTLLSLIQKLPPGYRVVFNMYVFEEYSHKDIAESLNISENTSKTQLLKARRFLRKRLAELRPTIKTVPVDG